MNLTEKCITHELFVCDCDNPAHQFVINTYDFGDGSPYLDVTIKLNPYLPWYRRFFIAFKYFFGFDSENQFDVVVLNNESIVKFKKALEKFQELEKQALIKDYKF